MFVQVFQGKVRDADLLVRQYAKFRKEIKPKTTGYLGSTTGITDDGYGITVARFRSEETARADSALPEQGKWWEETSKAFDGDVTFHDCRDVDVLLDGGSNDARFVQVMQGRAKDQAHMRRQEKEMETELASSVPISSAGSPRGMVTDPLPRSPTSPPNPRHGKTSRPWRKVLSTSSSRR